MAPDLLASICNVATNPRYSCLLRLDTRTQRAEWIDVGIGELLVSGVGICADDRYVYHASVAQAGFRTLLTVLERDNLKVASVQELPGVADVHSIQRHGDELFVVSTETDEVLAFRMDGTDVTGKRLVWSPSGSGLETHHLNSLFVAEGELLCSGFGEKEGGSWATAKHGYVYNITTDTVLVTGLRQPHTACWHDDELYFCNSLEGSVNTADGVVTYLSGYTRGLAFGPDGTMFAGTSLSRRPKLSSDDTRLFLNPSAPGELIGQCAVVEMRQGGHRVETGISTYASEIYDLMLL